MESYWHDLRYGFRMLLKSRGFTAVAVIALALGVGATSAVFSIMNSVLLHPLPFDAEQIVMIWDNNISRGHEEVEVSYPNFLDWREQNKVFEQMAALPSVNLDMTLTGGDEPEKVEGTFASVSFFSLLGVNAAMGRTFLPEDDKPDAKPVVVISEGLWKRRYGSVPNIIGKEIVVDGENATIVGVMPGEFDFPKGVDLWAALTYSPDSWMKSRNFRVLRAIGRLKEGVTVAQAQADMDTIAARLSTEYPKDNEGFGVILIPLIQTIFGNVRPALYILMGAVFFVLLIACVNVANLLLARAATREREIAVRMTLGAGRLRLIRQLLTESLLLAIIGGGLGLLLAAYGIDYLVALAPEDIPRIKTVGINGQVILFTLALTFATSIIFGLAPTLQASRPNLNDSLKDSSTRTGGSVRGKRLRSFLVVSEIALSVILMVGAGLMVRSFSRLQSLDPGYRPENILTFRLALVQSKYPKSENRKAFFEQLLKRIEALPGVESAAVVLMRPLSGTVGWDYPFTVEGQNTEDQAANPYSNYEAISPNYFRTMGIPVIKGRDFTDQDRSDAIKVVIVSESMARKYWPDEDPLGKRIRFGKPESNAPWLEVVGVVKDGRYREWDATRFDIYAPYLQKSEYRTDFVIKTKINPLSLAGSIRSEVYAIDKDQAITAITTMEELVSNTLSRPRFNMLLLSVFAVLSLILAAVGVYGVMAYSVSQRTGEIGVRVALGAQNKDILRLIVGQGLLLALIGIVTGMAGAVALTRVMSSLLFGVSATDPLTFLVIAVLLAGVAVLACYIPARRALKIDPIVALRHE
jgi:putative ABC transport system permease protein